MAGSIGPAGPPEAIGPAGPPPSPSPPASPKEDESPEEKTSDSQPSKPKRMGMALHASEKSQKMGALPHEDLDWIYIGDAEDARDASALRAANVRYVLNCTMPRAQGGVMNYHEKDKNFEYCRLALADNATEPLPKRCEAAWDFFEKVRIREDGNILVHCQQGVSRSVSMVIAYLIKYYRYNFDSAKTLCLGCRKQANPNEGFEKQLREMEEQLHKGAYGGFEKVPPPRKRAASTPAGGPMKAARGPAGPARGPVGPAGPPRGPAGAARGPVGPSVGPAVGPSVGPSVGPAGPPVGPSVGPAVGPAVGPSVGPAAGPSAEKKEKKDKKEKKEKKAMMAGPSPP